MNMFSIANALLGGLGLFLVGMWLMTDGLKLAAGNALRELLNTWTNTRIRGLITGFGITALVQSSSAVTVATIGFANAGLLTLGQAIWVIFGSNVGTTMTGWIVAVVGFKIDMDAFALPLVGLGMIIRLTGVQSRRAAIGQAMVGFGLFFLGIGVLKEAFESLGAGIALPSVEEAGLGSLFLYVLLGFVLTSLMQSSSAAIVITLSAAEGGLIPLSAAAATVIGANLGTTTTAILSVWGATPVAKRVATSHVLFNVITGLIAIIIILPMLMLIGFIQDLFNLPSAPAMSLALFHTVFNLLGVILMIPLADSLVNYLSRHFVSEEESGARLAYLDDNILEVPALAVTALSKELSRFHTLVMDTVSRYISAEEITPEQLSKDNIRIEGLTDHIAGYVAKIGRTSLPQGIAENMPEVMQFLQQNVMVVDNLCDAADLSKDIELKQMNQEQLDSLTSFNLTCVNILSELRTGVLFESPELMVTTLDKLEQSYDAFRLTMLKAGVSGSLSMRVLDAQLQQVNLIKRTIKYLAKASQRLHGITTQFNPVPLDNKITEPVL